MTKTPSVAIIGGGLAGSEAALQLAARNIPVTLYEMKPVKRSPAHHADTLAEIVCSNSFGNLQISTASGLLKAEMRELGCKLIAVADQLAVPAGNALAVDRDKFSQEVTRLVDESPLITRVAEDVSQIPDADFVIIATGPLTSPDLANTLQNLLNQKQLYFFDAAAPIIMKDSINFDIAFFQNRYDKHTLSPGERAGVRGQEDQLTQITPHPTPEGVDLSPRERLENAYINCPLNKEEYYALVEKLLTAEKTELKDFEKESASFFESCMPVEVIASRGKDTLAFGPMKPVGIVDPRTNERPYAVVQLRQDNAEGTLYNIVGFQTNLKWGVQKEMIQMIPGLENAEVIRYGVMHRNTYINSPEVLQPTMQLRNHPNILLAGQLTGVEGYTECIASGLRAAMTVFDLIENRSPQPMPLETMMGALFGYITRAGVKNFQPINSNWGILPPLPVRIKDKATRNGKLADNAIQALATFKATLNPSPYRIHSQAVSPAGIPEGEGSVEEGLVV